MFDRVVKTFLDFIIYFKNSYYVCVSTVNMGNALARFPFICKYVVLFVSEKYHNWTLTLANICTENFGKFLQTFLYSEVNHRRFPKSYLKSVRRL